MMKQTERDKFMYRDKVIFFAAVAVFHHFGWKHNTCEGKRQKRTVISTIFKE